MYAFATKRHIPALQILSFAWFEVEWVGDDVRR